MIKKLYFVSFIALSFLVLPAIPVLAENSPKTFSLEIDGTGKAPLKGTSSVSRRIALTMAKRNAVENAVGAAVSVEMLPNRREVMSRVEGTLSYELLHEGEEDGFYVVNIRAKVDIPADLVDGFPLSEDEKETHTGFKPLMEEFPSGLINWEEGFLLAYGMGKRPGGKDAATAELMARRAAVADAQAKALELINGIRLDAEIQVEGRISKNEGLFYKIEGLVKGSKIVEEDRGKPYKVTLKVALTGVKGISAVFINRKRKEKGRTPSGPYGEDEKTQFTGIIIDARGTGLKTAFFPEIKDENGLEVYSVKDVDDASFLKRGVVGYATGEEEAIQSGRVGDNPLIIKGALPDYFSGYPMVASLETVKISSDNFVVAKAKKKKRKRRARRQGSRPLRLKSSKSGGSLKANVIISASDARRIAKSRRFARAFRQSRVVILTDSMIGGTEGRYLDDMGPIHAELRQKYRNE